VTSLGAPKDKVELVRSADLRARDMLEVWWESECRRTTQKAVAYKVPDDPKIDRYRRLAVDQHRLAQGGLI
jgi:hypothetical protein